MPTADLSVTMDDGKTTVVPGTTDTYTIIVTNNGPDTLSSLTLIPGFRLSNPIFSPPSAGSYDQLAEVWSGLSLATGQSASITLSGAIPNAPGSLINAVAVAPPAGTTDPNPANNIATDTDTVTPLATADLSVTVTDGKTTVAPGDIDTYTITVTNNGPDTLSSLTLIEAVALSSPIFGPPSAGSYDPLTGAWTGLSLATGQTVSLTLSGAVTPSATGSLTNIVAVAPPAGTSDINPANNAASDTDTVTVVISPNPSPPPATSANMILRRADGLYATYDIGNNTILAGYPLVQVGTDWRFAGLGGFQARDTSDMLLRNASTGGFQVYDISNNNIANTAFLGNVGMDWQVMGFGNFSSRGETDMILRNSNTGAVEVYDIANNQITGANLLGSVGLDWQFSGVGNFSGAGGTDLLLRNANTGGLEVYDIANNQITAVRTYWAASASIGSSRASAISAASPAKPISSCATSIPARWRSMTSTTINSRTPLSSAPSAWTGSLPALPRCAAPACPTSSCATSPPAHSRPITSPTIRSSAPPTWDRWDWSGRSAASPLILRPQQPRSSCRQWPLLAAVARPTDRTLRRLMPTPHSRPFWRNRTREPFFESMITSPARRMQSRASTSCPRFARASTSCLLASIRKTWMAPQLGLARVAHYLSAASRVNPTCGDKPMTQAPGSIRTAHALKVRQRTRFDGSNLAHTPLSTWTSGCHIKVAIRLRGISKVDT
jgi:uncharacterized repeat protein (TIGR01451 family)